MKRRTAAIGLCIAANCGAHDGVVHEQSNTSAVLDFATETTRPHRLPDGSLHVPKPVQHLLAIRTQVWTATDAAPAVSLLAEVQAQPASTLTVTAPEPGRLEAAAAWPLPGQTVRAGAVLAWLRPLIAQRDAARRRAQIADLDQKLVIADINADRLSLQKAVNPENKDSTGNIYYEQAIAERDALRGQRELLANSLKDRVPLIARGAGQVVSAPARNGDVVASGQTLFQLSDASRLRLVAVSFDATLGRRLRSASLESDEDSGLSFRGQEPLASSAGWRLLFDLEPRASALTPGQLVTIRVQSSTEGRATVPDEACVIDANGSASVWVHRTSESFTAIAVPFCGANVAIDPAAIALKPGDRLVTEGAALLAQYR